MKPLKKLLIFTLLGFMYGQVALSQPAKTTAPKKFQKEVKNRGEEDGYSTVTTYGVTTSTNSTLVGGFVIRNSKKLENPLFGHTQFRYMAIEAVNIKHPKEVPIPTSTGSRFVPAKLNHLFSIRPQYGREIILASRNGDEGIAVNAILAAGLSIGLQKPYYIQYQLRPGVTKTEAYNPMKHPIETIVGSGSVLRGLGQAKIIPGINLKSALSFELSAFKNNLTGLEIGFLVEAFSQKADIMYLAENKSTYTSAYLTLYFGNKK